MDIQIDIITICISLALIVLACLSSCMNPFFRFSKHEEEKKEEGVLPPVSIILTPHEDAHRLEKHLPTLLLQDYPTKYQVVIVIERGDHETEDVLKRIKNTYIQGSSNVSIYVTYIPETSRYMSRKKLAVTLGVKAATSEWIMMTEPSSVPVSYQWLKTMASNCTDSTNLVIGYGCYDKETSAYKRFERLHIAYYLMREDAKGIAYRSNAHNLMFRKSEFIEQGGYLGNLHLVRGEYDFIVNKYARKGEAVLETSQDAWVIDDTPTQKTWLNDHIFYLETRKYLKRSFWHRALFNLDQILLHFNYLTIFAAITYASVCSQWEILVAATIALLTTIILRMIIGKRAIRNFGEDIPALMIIPYEIGIIWRQLSYIIRHHSADKLNFTTHKL